MQNFLKTFGVWQLVSWAWFPSADSPPQFCTACPLADSPTPSSPNQSTPKARISPSPSPSRCSPADSAGPLLHYGCLPAASALPLFPSLLCLQSLYLLFLWPPTGEREGGGGFKYLMTATGKWWHAENIYKKMQVLI